MLLDSANICCECTVFEAFVPDEELKVTGHPTLLSISHSCRESVNHIAPSPNILSDRDLLKMELDSSKSSLKIHQRAIS